MQDSLKCRACFCTLFILYSCFCSLKIHFGAINMHLYWESVVFHFTYGVNFFFWQPDKSTKTWFHVIQYMGVVLCCSPRLLLKLRGKMHIWVWLFFSSQSSHFIFKIFTFTWYFYTEVVFIKSTYNILSEQVLLYIQKHTFLHFMTAMHMGPSSDLLHIGDVSRAHINFHFTHWLNLDFLKFLAI